MSTVSPLRIEKTTYIGLTANESCEPSYDIIDDSNDQRLEMLDFDQLKQLHDLLGRLTRQEEGGTK